MPRCFALAMRDSGAPRSAERERDRERDARLIGDICLSGDLDLDRRLLGGDLDLSRGTTLYRHASARSNEVCAWRNMKSEEMLLPCPHCGECVTTEVLISIITARNASI